MEFGEDPLLQQYLQQIHGVHCQVLDDCSCNNPKKNKNKSNISRNFLFSSSLPQKKKKKKKNLWYLHILNYYESKALWQFCSASIGYLLCTVSSPYEQNLSNAYTYVNTNGDPTGFSFVSFCLLFLCKL